VGRRRDMHDPGDGHVGGVPLYLELSGAPFSLDHPMGSQARSFVGTKREAVTGASARKPGACCVARPEPHRCPRPVRGLPLAVRGRSRPRERTAESHAPAGIEEQDRRSRGGTVVVCGSVPQRRGDFERRRFVVV
jgi:hypothetical protein